MKKSNNGGQVVRFRLGDAFNVHDPALHVLAEKGFSLGLYPPTDEAGRTLPESAGIGDWWARRGDLEFVAETPIALLGLVALWEARGENWSRKDEVDLYRKIIADAYDGPA